MTMRTPLLRALLAVAAGAIASGAFAATPPAASTAAGAPSFCILLIADEAGEAVINRCSQCRSVTLERTRTAEMAPTVRALTLVANSLTPSPFRGPGRTRVIGEDVCPAARSGSS